MMISIRALNVCAAVQICIWRNVCGLFFFIWRRVLYWRDVEFMSRLMDYMWCSFIILTPTSLYCPSAMKLSAINISNWTHVNMLLCILLFICLLRFDFKSKCTTFPSLRGRKKLFGLFREIWLIEMGWPARFLNFFAHKIVKNLGVYYLITTCKLMCVFRF